MSRQGRRWTRRVVEEARREEVSFMKGIELYDEVDERECWEEIGKGPISTRWVDINKGTEEDPLVRCRLAARDFKGHGDGGRADLFAAISPLEALRMVLRLAMVEKVWER